MFTSRQHGIETGKFFKEECKKERQAMAALKNYIHLALDDLRHPERSTATGRDPTGTGVTLEVNQG